MLGLALAMPDGVRTTFATFSEGGRAGAFLDEVRSTGSPPAPLKRATSRTVSRPCARSGRTAPRHRVRRTHLPRLQSPHAGAPRGAPGGRAGRRGVARLDRRNAPGSVLRVARPPAPAVHGSRRVRVRRAGGEGAQVVPSARTPPERDPQQRPARRVREDRPRRAPAVARVLLTRSSAPEPHSPLRGRRLPPRGGEDLLAGEEFAGDSAVSQIVLGAGRFSPEKGFGVLVEAAAATSAAENPAAGVVLFGEGPLRAELERRIAEQGLRGRVVLPGFRTDLDSLIGGADVVVLPSYTEGLPNVALEASAAGVPVVATAVGGNRAEAIANGVNGSLVAPGATREAWRALKSVNCSRDANLRARLARRPVARGCANCSSPSSPSRRVPPLASHLAPHTCRTDRLRRQDVRSARSPPYVPEFRPVASLPVQASLLHDRSPEHAREPKRNSWPSSANSTARTVYPSLVLLDGEDDLSRALEPADCPALRLGVRKLFGARRAQGDGPPVTPRSLAASTGPMCSRCISSTPRTWGRPWRNCAG